MRSEVGAWPQAAAVTLVPRWLVSLAMTLMCPGRAVSVFSTPSLGPYMLS